jgi:uncharacterized protein
MHTLPRWIGLAFALISARAATDAPYVSEIESWHASRVARLTAPDGWLTLIGLHFLREGENRIGRAKDNDIVLTQGPEHFGVATLAADGRVTFTLADGVDGTIDGARPRTAELRWREPNRPTVVVAGAVSFFVIDRGGRKALRVKDREADRRTHFAGLEYFPVDPAWRIEARWEPFEKARQIPITNILGQTSPALVHGQAVFERGGKTFALLPIDEGPDEPLFFVISDATSGRETYDAGRFVYADPPRDGIVVIDFNRAENPPCAFTPFATCPLPPKENRLPFAVNAGEKRYRGEHE